MSDTKGQNGIRRLFTATLIIGVSGSGKTTQAAAFADYLWESYKKILLLYSWDGGAIPTDVQRRMKQGLIRFWRARTRSAEGLGMETVYQATRGYWPRRINALTGETSPAVELVPSVTVTYRSTCPKGHPLQVVNQATLLSQTWCKDCQLMYGPAQASISETLARTKGFEMVGGVFYDGLTSMSQIVMEHMDAQRGAGLVGGEKSSFGGVVQSGSQKWGGNNRADVGFAQQRAAQFVHNALGIPNLAEGPVFTALSTEGTDEGGLQVIGVDLPGRAATATAVQWFGNVVEQGQMVDDDGKLHVALYLKPYTDKQGRRHLLKSSGSVEMPDLLVDPPLEQKRPQVAANLGQVFRLLDDDLRRSLENELPGAPGIPEEFMEYGEGAGSAPSVVAPGTPGRPVAPGPVVPPSAPAGPAPARPVTPATPVVPTGPIMPARPRAVSPQPVAPPPAAAVSAAAEPAPAPTTVTSTAAPPPGMRPPARLPKPSAPSAHSAHSAPQLQATKE